jgi:Tfp pilus assembly protein PilX
MNRRYNRKSSGGYALITALIFFLAGTTAVIAGLSDAVLREVRVVRNESTSKQAYFASESALEDAIYRIKESKAIGSSGSLDMESSSASITITAESDGTQKIVSLGDASGLKRIVEASLNIDQGVTLPFSLHGGLGGIDLEGGSTIMGDIYTTGSIRGCGTCDITGSAVAAGKSSSSLNQSNDEPSPPPNSLTFGNANATQDLAQSFSVSQSLSITALDIFVRKNGNPANATIRLVTDNSGSPSSTVLSTGTLSSSLVSTAYTWQSIALSSNPILTAGTTYWIVIDANTNASNYYVAGGNASTFTNGLTKTGRYNLSSWNATSPANLDMYFKLSIGSSEAGITGEDQWNMLTVGSAYAYQAAFVDTTGSLYCQIGTSNNKACNTSRGDPAIENFPISDVLITTWKAEAESGGTGSNLTVGSAGATLGPRKISGNLLVNGGGTLLVSGTIWVTGDVTITGGASVSPVNSSKSYAIIADGTITLEGGSEVTGSSDSHILLLSTSVIDPAVSIWGGADDTAVVAPYGGILIDGGASISAAAARHIRALGGSNIIYDPNMSQLDFDSGVSGGGGFGIKSWKETQ